MSERKKTDLVNIISVFKSVVCKLEDDHIEAIGRIIDAANEKGKALQVEINRKNGTFTFSAGEHLASSQGAPHPDIWSPEYPEEFK